MTFHRLALVPFLIAAFLPLNGCGDDDRRSDVGIQQDTGPVIDASDDANSDTFVVDFETSAGAFAVEVNNTWSLNGAARFRELVESGYYDDQRIFRVVPGFVAQWGLNGDPATTALWNDNNIPDDPVVESNIRGYLSFAKTSEPNSRSAQVFVSFGDNSFLDAMGFAPFGRIVSGLDVIDAFNGEYGDTPEQGRIVSEGNTYLDATYPNLTRIITARIR